MRQDAGPPDEIPGFGSCLLWLIATRGAAAIDVLYQKGPPNPTKKVLMEDGHHLPTIAAVAWLLAAIELGKPVAGLYRGDPELARAQKLLAVNVTRYLNETPYLFKEEWLEGIAAICGFSGADLQLLRKLRLEPGVEIKFDKLRRVVEKTRTSMPPGQSPAERAITIFQEVPDVGGEAESLNLHGELALSHGEPWRARPRFNEALRIAEKIGSAEDARVARDGLARCDEAGRDDHPEHDSG